MRRVASAARGAGSLRGRGLGTAAADGDDASAASSSAYSRCSSLPGIHAELIRDHLTRLRVRLKRLGPPPRLLKGPHQQRPQPLPQRMLRHEAAQLGYHLGRPAAGEVRLDAQLGRGEPQLGRPVGVRGEQR